MRGETIKGNPGEGSRARHAPAHTHITHTKLDTDAERVKSIVRLSASLFTPYRYIAGIRAYRSLYDIAEEGCHLSTVPKSTPRGGRPKSYASADDLQAAVDSYWETLRRPRRDAKGQLVINPDTGEPYIDDEVIPPTEADLILHLAITPQTWYEYAKEENDHTYPGYSDVIACARLRLEGYANRMLYTREGARGAEVQLTRKHRARGWEDRQTLEVTGSITAVAALPADVSELRRLVDRAMSALPEAKPVIEVVPEVVQDDGKSD